MKSSYRFFAGPMVLAVCMAASYSYASDVKESAAPSDFACSERLSQSAGAPGHFTCLFSALSSPKMSIVQFVQTRTRTESSYFSVDRRHRPAWWRSAGSKPRHGENF
ncbi:hypothetical protein IWQ49_004849 [Labrenzia sp. EL_126]|nr:hypothetical protein [Labrenzia sp. EL_126]